MTATTLTPAATVQPAARKGGAALLRSILLTIGATGGLMALGFAMRGDGDTAYQTPAWALWIHLATVIPALPLGAWVLWGRKGTAGHKLAGRVWMAMMIITAIDSFWIRSLTGGIGPIHIFSVLTLYSLPMSIVHARRGNIAAHKRSVTGVYIGLVVAGAFSMVPGRMLPTLIFG